MLTDALAGAPDAFTLDELRTELREHFDGATLVDMVALNVKDQVERIMGVVTSVLDTEVRSDAAADSVQPWVIDGPGRPDYIRLGPTSTVCPQCGHALSLYQEPADSRPNAAATRLADAMGSWRYIVALAVATLSYVFVALTMYPSDTGKAIALNYLGIGMTTLVGIQTPLMLLAQRMDASRDRARDRESLRVANRAEYDLHRIREALEHLSGQRPPPQP